MKDQILINYRRDDTSGYARLIFDRLISHFGEDRIFMDVDGIEPGQDFVKVIDSAVGSCKVLIALIGRNWKDVADESGNRRLENPEDFVRLEIQTALTRDIPVIPTLIQGATMPNGKDLPEDIKSLTRRQAIEINHKSFNTDVERLIRSLEKIFKKEEYILTIFNKVGIDPEVLINNENLGKLSDNNRLVYTDVQIFFLKIIDKTGIYETVILSIKLNDDNKNITYEYKPTKISIQNITEPKRKEKTFWKAILFHLLVGFGFFYIDRSKKRKWLYPVLFMYALINFILSLTKIEPFYNTIFGGASFASSFGIYLYGFIDVYQTFMAQKKLSKQRD